LRGAGHYVTKLAKAASLSVSSAKTRTTNGLSPLMEQTGNATCYRALTKCYLDRVNEQAAYTQIVLEARGKVVPRRIDWP
jgi:hypothetical protein